MAESHVNFITFENFIINNFGWLGLNIPLNFYTILLYHTNPNLYSLLYAQKRTNLHNHKGSFQAKRFGIMEKNYH